MSTRPLHPVHIREGITPLVISKRQLVCIKCGGTFKLGTGGVTLNRQANGRHIPASMGRCGPCETQRLTRSS